MDSFMPIPPEMRSAIEAELERRNMSIDSFRHDILRMLDELEQDHLAILRHLFTHFLSMDEATLSAFVGYLDGMSAQILKTKFNICPSCQIDHDKQLLDPAKEDQQAVPLFTESGDLNPEALPDEPTEADYLRECARFGVKPEDENGKVKCKNCLQVYVSLADRMIKPPGPENCEGCVSKTKWG